MDSATLPIACTLTQPELQARRSAVLNKFKDAVLEVKEMETGYAYRFPTDVKSIAELADLITSEHLCCAFLRFNLIVEPGDGPIWLELSGPDGTKDFLNSLLA